MKVNRAGLIVGVSLAVIPILLTVLQAYFTALNSPKLPIEAFPYRVFWEGMDKSKYLALISSLYLLGMGYYIGSLWSSTFGKPSFKLKLLKGLKNLLIKRSRRKLSKGNLTLISLVLLSIIIFVPSFTPEERSENSVKVKIDYQLPVGSPFQLVAYKAKDNGQVTEDFLKGDDVYIIGRFTKAVFKGPLTLPIINATLQVFLDGDFFGQVVTDSDGFFRIALGKLDSGEHIVLLKYIYKEEG